MKREGIETIDFRLLDHTPTDSLSSDLVLVPNELPLPRNPAALYLSHLAPSGRRSLQSFLSLIARTATDGRADVLSFAWHRLRYEHAAAILNALRASHRAASVNLARAALRGIFREAWRAGLVDLEQYEKLKDLPRARGERLPRGRALEPGELRALFLSCEKDHSPAGARDAALMGLLYGCGLRLTEAVSVDLQAFSGDSIKILGKGGKERRVFLPAGAQKALASWLRARGTAAGALFFAIAKGGRIDSRRLSSDGARHAICQKRASRAGVSRFASHDFRKTYISHLLEAGADLAEVAALVGHSTVETTRQYDRRPEDSRKKTAKLVNVPYGGGE